MSKDRYTPPKPGRESPVSVRHHVGTPPIRYTPWPLNQSITSWQAPAENGRPPSLKPKPQMPTTGLPFWRA
jgi:hypothetical protein